jgi:hypothetical protein
MSLGVTDETLTNIGRVVVMGAKLDYQRMKLLEVVADVPIADSARWDRKRLKDEIRDSFDRSPLDRLSERVGAWLTEVDNLLDLRDRYAHSITYHEVRGDGTRGSYISHPKTGIIRPEPNAAAWEALVLRLSDALSVGVTLDIEARILRHQGVEAHDAHRRAHEEYEARVEEMLNMPLEELTRISASDTAIDRATETSTATTD